LYDEPVFTQEKYVFVGVVGLVFVVVVIIFNWQLCNNIISKCTSSALDKPLTGNQILNKRQTQKG